ncbi:RIP metalloprotease RseP [Ewingella americana]
MMNILWSLAAFIVALGVLITVHEFGHFWVARRCGVYVQRFSVGFGRTLWRRTDKHGTEYVLAVIPLGGYVKMLDERNETVPDELRHQSFNSKTVWQRAAIISAGPIANFIFAVFAYWLVFIIGVPAVRPVVGEVTPQSIAAQSNISPGMELKSIDGIETPDWDSVRLSLIGEIGNNQTTLGVSQFGASEVVEKKLDLTQWRFDPEKQDPVVALGIIPRGPQIESVLAEVQTDSAAQKAGLQAGDRIVKVDGQVLANWRTFAMQVRDNPGKPIALEVERAGSSVDITLTPGH